MSTGKVMLTFIAYLLGSMLAGYVMNIFGLVDYNIITRPQSYLFAFVLTAITVSNSYKTKG